MPYFHKYKVIIIIALLWLLQGCTGGEGAERTTVTGEWKMSHQAEIEAMSAEERKFYESLSDDKKEEIEEASQVEYYFHKDGKFEKIHQKKTDKGKWKLSIDKKLLTITYNDGKTLKLIVKKLTTNQLRVGTKYGLQRTDIILVPY